MQRIRCSVLQDDPDDDLLYTAKFAKLRLFQLMHKALSMYDGYNDNSYRTYVSALCSMFCKYRKTCVNIVLHHITTLQDRAQA